MKISYVRMKKTLLSQTCDRKLAGAGAADVAETHPHVLWVLEQQ